jgi:hypothetical protein
VPDTPRVRVTAHDPVTGDTDTQELDPRGYVLIVGEHLERCSVHRYRNGTIQLTLKPKDRKR